FRLVPSSSCKGTSGWRFLQYAWSCVLSSFCDALPCRTRSHLTAPSFLRPPDDQIHSIRCERVSTVRREGNGRGKVYKPTALVQLDNFHPTRHVKDTNAGSASYSRYKITPVWTDIGRNSDVLH